ncbi:MAG: FAD-binding protein, partial [Deltaproteobacteria bacterium]|nr:FAD-binding protein [Deltaproteobacteria bacterium]
MGLTSALIEAVHNLGVREILTATAASKILRHNGRVCGLEAVDTKSGDLIEIRSKTVVMATGGFNSNLEMILELRPELKPHKILVGGGPGATGDGHKLVRDIGGYLTHMEQIWFYVYATADYRDPRGQRGLVFRMIPGYIWVNQQGRR